MSDHALPLSDDGHFSLPDNVIFQRFDQHALLIDLDGERVYQLNPTGSRVVELLSEERSLGEILVILDQEYQAESGTLDRDVRDLLADLLSQGLITPKS